MTCDLLSEQGRGGLSHDAGHDDEAEVKGERDEDAGLQAAGRKVRLLSCSFGGRPGRGAHQALANLQEVIAGRKVEWVLEADLKNFFGSLSHEWMLRFVEHGVGDPRLISLIRRWLKANVLEDEELHANEEGTPQGGSISVLLS